MTPTTSTKMSKKYYHILIAHRGVADTDHIMTLGVFAERDEAIKAAHGHLKELTEWAKDSALDGNSNIVPDKYNLSFSVYRGNERYYFEQMAIVDAPLPKAKES